MTLELNKTEQRILAETLEAKLSRLQDEIAHTDSREYRETLKQRKEVLQKITERLN